jgi:hypothetical protein
MHVTGFLQCLSGNNFQSGNLVAYYDFSKGNANVVFNQKYPTGQAYSGIYINSASNPGIFIGTGTGIGGQASTKIGYELGLNRFNAIFDFDFSGCQNTGAAEASVLLTTRTGHADNGGFIFGINTSNRLFFETSNQIYTLNHQLATKNIINLNIGSSGDVSFGHYDFISDTGEYRTAQIQPDSFSDLYLINYPSGTSNLYGPALGRLNYFALLDDFIIEQETLTNCLFCTGIAYSSGIVSGTLISVSGISGLNIYESGVTGQQQTLVTVQKEDGSTVSVVHLVDLSGLLLVDTQIVPIITSGVNVSFTAYSPNLRYNSSEKMNYTLRDAHFGLSLSGSNYEVYSYDSFQPNKNIRVLDFTLPLSSLYLNLFINGLLETEGVDFNVLDGITVDLINSPEPESDILVANYSLNPTITIEYAEQFPLNGANEVCITGSGFYSGHDVYQNGQKLALGGDYYTGLYLSNVSLIIMSGVLVNGDELKFYPRDTEPFRSTGKFATESYYISGLSGYSPQIWVNGTLQTVGEDYYLSQACFDDYYFLSSNSNLLVYNNDDYYLNV